MNETQRLAPMEHSISPVAARRSPNQTLLTAVSPNFSKNNYRFFSQKGKNRRLMPESTISSNDL